MFKKTAICIKKFPGMVFILLALLAPVYALGNLTMLLAERPLWGVSLARIPSRVHGPFPLDDPPPQSYRFHEVPGSLGNAPLWRIEELSREHFEALMLERTPRKLKEGMKRWLKPGLLMAEKYQVDPFWVMAVMWVESHFNPRAKSRVQATGLMQILPGTGHFLGHLMGRPLPKNLIYRMLEEVPEINVEMGVFYLRRLLRRFSGNYTLATVAYNMGPTTVQKRLRLGLPVGVSNNYLNKVRDAYFKISRGYRIHLVKSSPAWRDTFVAQRRKKVKTPDFLFPAKKKKRLYALAF